MHSGVACFASSSADKVDRSNAVAGTLAPFFASGAVQARAVAEKDSVTDVYV
jgi:hypothetical protein